MSKIIEINSFSDDRLFENLNINVENNKFRLDLIFTDNE